MSEVKKPVKPKLKEYPFKSDKTYLLKLANGNYCVGVVFENSWEEPLTGEQIEEKIEAYISLEEIIDE
jgi:hypothetical protein